MADNKFIVGDTAKNLLIRVTFDEVIDFSGATVLLFHGAFANYDPASAFMGPVTQVSVDSDSSSTTYIGTYDVEAIDTVAAFSKKALSVRVTHPNTDVETIKSAGSTAEVILC